MFCENCETQIDNDAKFCYSCGNKITMKQPLDEMTCQNCGKYIDKDTKFCENCGIEIEKYTMTKSVVNEPIKSLQITNKKISLVIAILIGIVLFLMSFHIVTNGGITFIPKEHLSFADTFVNVNSYIKRYNEADQITRLSMVGTYLHRKLMGKDFIRIIE